MENTIKKSSITSLVTGTKGKYQEICQGLFQLRDQLHIAHLRSKSYAEHVALNEVYDSILDSADDITELFQSYLGILNLVIPESSFSEPIPLLKAARTKYLIIIAELDLYPDIQNKGDDKKDVCASQTREMLILLKPLEAGKKTLHRWLINQLA